MLSLTGVIVIVTVAVSVWPSASLTSVGEAVDEVLAAVVRVAERAVGVQRQRCRSSGSTTGVVSTVSVSFGRSSVRVVVQQLRAAVQQLVAVPPSATVTLSASATGVLSLTGVIVIVTVAVSVLSVVVADLGR